MQVPSPLLSVVPLFDAGTAPLVVLPLIVVLAVLARGAYTREPTHIALAAVAVPCLLVSAWAVAESQTPSGVRWGGLFSAAAGGLLAFLVVVDAAVAGVLRARATE